MIYLGITLLQISKQMWICLNYMVDILDDLAKLTRVVDTEGLLDEAVDILKVDAGLAKLVIQVIEWFLKFLKLKNVIFW